MRPALIKKNVSLKFHSTESVIIEFEHFTGKFDHFFAIKANPIVLPTPLEKKGQQLEGEVAPLQNSSRNWKTLSENGNLETRNRR